MIKKTAIIIGASGDIGVATAKLFAKKGYNLALTYNKQEIDLSMFENTKSEIKTYQLNLQDEKQIGSFFDELAQDFKYFDALIFCAGKAQKRLLISDITDDEVNSIFDINIKSAIKSVRNFTKMVLNRNPANIVLVGSFVEKSGCSCESVYTASKSALSGLCKSLGTELGNLDIRCNVVAPGFIDTKMNNNLTQEEKDEIANITPLKRLGRVEDVANAVCFLISEEASFITGQTLFVDGGLLLE